ncbi:lysozyme [Lonepinella koalarum]|uniref:Lysozyme n=1 Tax=Lonepinella koalarum TaxID=53417 RepID=A0A4R1KZH9_9PAST|nr:lysozyme [Lonepinella koalarum]TCK70087.1 GH24 family phage-related lysozyme (muramidase) [Lonepinella koalarum]TFJ90317.1 lysozyme [Lonepinella koalarum]
MNENQWNISEQGINALKGYEALRTKAYLDDAGKWTIGYGHTGKVGNIPVRQGMEITEQQAEELFKSRLPEFENAVRNNVNVPLSQNQYDALVSLAYNIGPTAFSNSTLVKKLNAGDMDGAAEQFMAWRKVGDKDNQGLINRRNREREMFLGVGEGQAPNIPLPTQYDNPYDSPVKKGNNPLNNNIYAAFNPQGNQTAQNNPFSHYFNQLNGTLEPLSQEVENPTPSNRQKYQSQLAAAFGVTPQANNGMPDYIGDLVKSIYDQA